MFEVLSIGTTGFGDEILLGAWLTLKLALTSLVLGMLVGLATAAGKLSNSRMARFLSNAYTEIVRGVPEMLVVLVVFFGASVLMQTILGWFGYDAYFEVNAFFAGALALGMVFGAFAGEVLRGGFLAVPHGQIEAGIACGMTGRQAFYRIRLPQMWRFALPGLGNLWMVLLKDTSLISVIALDELLRWSKVGAETTKQPFTFYMAAAFIYLIFAVLSDIGRYRLEALANRGVRKV